MRIKADRVEGLARGFDPHARENLPQPGHLERQPVHQRFGDRLDGERGAAVAHLVDLAIDGGDRDTEPVRVGPPEFRDISGHDALLKPGVLVMEMLQVLLDR